MDASVDSTVPNPAGKTSFWSNSRSTHKVEAGESLPSSTHSSSTGISTLDNVRTVFWQAYRHLFPPHAVAGQVSNGNLVISWSVADDPHANHPYAAPVMLRFDKDLLDTMWQTEPRGRMRIAQNHEPTLREGLRGYDPFARFPNARVINVG
jgi:hypothetical protein